MGSEEQQTGAQAQMLENRLRKRYRHLKKWAKRTGTGAFRLYDRDIPEIPLLLDLYIPDGEGDAAVAGAVFKRPYEKDAAEESRWLAAMKAAVSQALAVDTKNIFIKTRERQRFLSQYEKIAARRVTRIVSEGRLKFRLNLSDYLDSGLFLDRRVMRNMARSEAAGKSVLNLFSYTGSFSVYAAHGRAAATDSVDLSNTYLAWAAENFALNGIETETVSMENFFAGKYRLAHRLVRADVLVFLEQAAAARKVWDMIILDPPAFSNSKKMNGVLDLRRDHIELVARCLDLLAPGGAIWFSINMRRFNVKASALQEALAARSGSVTVTDIANKTVDEDFKGRKMPRNFIIAKAAAHIPAASRVHRTGGPQPTGLLNGSNNQIFVV
jgi:23S rRNA G2069 N7-methylase RlmK/C1962 C5-methylase RlmI